MAKKLNVSMVSYVNSKPFIYGLELSGQLRELEIQLEVPSKTAQRLLHQQVDLALVPVASLPRLKHVSRLTNYCIGAQDRVDSVFLFSAKPIDEVSTILLDSDSLTSCNLLQILCREFWKIAPNFVHHVDVEPRLVVGNTACLMIGDKALKYQAEFAYHYDLATAWNQWTNLPFVFAVWVGNEFARTWESKLNQAFELGISRVDQIAPIYQSTYPTVDILSYYQHSIDYSFSNQMQSALELFLEKMKRNESIRRQ